MKWQATAPSNIALIKYMGKSNEQLNLPSNASFSYTLKHLNSTVELELTDDLNDQWQPFQSSNINLAENEQKRFLKHLNLLKKYFNCEQHFIIRSVNNFPAACGLASSASSFAALTQCAANAFTDLLPDISANLNTTTHTLASLSRLGSGSSCRSFYDTWAIWRADNTEAIILPYSNLIHHTVVVNKNKKTISSSEAHRKVMTSELFHGRPDRAEKRLHQLIQFLAQQNWYSAYQICWQEFWDMHSLFETCAEPFSYFVPDSLVVLNYLREFWKSNQDGPLVTMDAGPNIHLLFRADQSNMINQMNQELNFQFI
jgi:diphosphomevalonate decarboxylase